MSNWIKKESELTKLDEIRVLDIKEDSDKLIRHIKNAEYYYRKKDNIGFDTAYNNILNQIQSMYRKYNT